MTVVGELLVPPSADVALGKRTSPPQGASRSSIQSHRAAGPCARPSFSGRLAGNEHGLCEPVVRGCVMPLNRAFRSRKPKHSVCPLALCFCFAAFVLQLLLCS